MIFLIFTPPRWFGLMGWLGIYLFYLDRIQAICQRETIVVL